MNFQDPRGTPDPRNEGVVPFGSGVNFQDPRGTTDPRNEGVVPFGSGVNFQDPRGTPLIKLREHNDRGMF